MAAQRENGRDIDSWTLEELQLMVAQYSEMIREQDQYIVDATQSDPSNLEQVH